MFLKTLALSPIIVPQALWVAARATRLPEAPGDRSGTLGSGPAKRLIILGDSSAAGVGASHQSRALAGHLTAELSAHYTVHWKLIAKSGETVASTLGRLEALPAEHADFVLIALGVNDAKNGVNAQRWAKGYRELLRAVSEKFSQPYICASGVPPLRHFPILPRPLNAVLGTRAEAFDALLEGIAATHPRTRHLPLDFPPDPNTLAPDGFHPGPEIYRQWSTRAAETFLKAADT